MKTSPCIAFLLLLLVFGCRKPEKYDLAVSNKTLFDSETGKTIPNKTILINRDTIAAIVDGNPKVLARKGIDGKGRLVTPGLVDTHIHLTDIFGICPYI
jgi:imidazolonepropionase-like amidohydrolase